MCILIKYENSMNLQTNMVRWNFGGKFSKKNVLQKMKEK
jgi:hypothetical protein